MGRRSAGEGVAARAFCLALALAAALAGQDAVTSDRLPPALAAAVPALVANLEHRDPLVRGEAALALALTHDARHYEAILAVAQDREAEARLRGIVALGCLAAPGAESFLGQILLESDRRSPDAAAAVHALGLLPDDRVVPALHTYHRMVDGSYRRHRDNLAAWLVALTVEPHPTSAARVTALLEDDSNHEPDLHRLALRALAAIPDRIEPLEISPWLASDEGHERIGALEAASAAGHELSPGELDRIAQIARRDRDPFARAAALRVLADHRHAAALDIAVRAVRSRDPREVAAGLEAARHLGGSATRAALERTILDERDPELQATMLAQWTLSVSEDFVSGCLALANDGRADPRVRVQAAALAARSKDARARAVLRALFNETEDPALLRTLASAICGLDPTLIALDRIYAPASPADLRAMPARIGALLASDHPAAVPALTRALGDIPASGRSGAALIRVLRTTLAPPPDPELVAMLPAPLQALYR